MKTIEQYFPVVLFVMMYKMVLTVEFVDESSSVTILMKAIEQYFIIIGNVILFNMLGRMV